MTIEGWMPASAATLRIVVASKPRAPNWARAAASIASRVAWDLSLKGTSQSYVCQRVLAVSYRAA
jgi:hypothetical protein